MRHAWLAPLLLLLLGCDLSSEVIVTSRTLQAELDLEIRDRVAITIEPSEQGDTMHVSLTPSAGYDLLAPGTALAADGKISLLPEATGTLYSAKLSSDGQLNGPCGSEPVSAALALHREGGNAYVVGGLSIYCGADRWYGNPVRILRIAGNLPLPQ
jgi:hypothetical protein